AFAPGLGSAAQVFRSSKTTSAAQRVKKPAKRGDFLLRPPGHKPRAGFARKRLTTDVPTARQALDRSEVRARATTRPGRAHEGPPWTRAAPRRSRRDRRVHRPGRLRG